MIYLLDVNALIGFGMAEHVLHRRVLSWVAGLNHASDHLASCAIAELGFLRIVPQTTSGTLTVEDAQLILMRVKLDSVIPFTFLADDLGADRLPQWAKLPRQTTDGHLLELARARKATLATCDQGIPGSFLIPHL